MSLISIKVPDIGEFQDVEIIEVLVTNGDVVEKDQGLITLESDKAAMEIPSTHSGTVKDIKVKVSDKVSEGSIILELETADNEALSDVKSEIETTPLISETSETSKEKIKKSRSATEGADLHAEVLVLGSGPGGYTAAFRAADLGKQVVMVERHERIGGVCLNVGCIPSKALLHTAQIINEAELISEHGVRFARPDIDIFKIRDWKDSVVDKLTKGLKGLARQRKVIIVRGEGTFSGPNSLEVTTDEGVQIISFDNCIIAAGSRVSKIPGFPYDDERLMDSTDALELTEIPDRMLIIGGGIIGLEMATVYDALGADITVVELQDSLIPGADKDIVKPLYRRLTAKYENIYLNTRVSSIESLPEGLKVSFSGKGATESDFFDRVLVAVGRSPNGNLISADNAGVKVDAHGFIPVDGQMRTNVEHIFAIGDIVGQPMLAHKATHEAKVAAEVIAGEKSCFEPMTIPSVAYTDPEIAWAGITETEAKAKGISYEKGAFPWAASGRSLSIGRAEGLTKALFDKKTGRIIGAAVVGTNAGELIAEAVLAIEMGADMQDIALSIHPHPTLSETLGFAAEMAEGTITDLLSTKKPGPG